MTKTVIKVENVAKQYRLGEISTGSLAHDVNRWWYAIRGKQNPYLKVGEQNDRTKKGSSEYAWALRDISFEVKQGEVLGIIGRNGAGKSTLLKLLSRTTLPTTGSIKAKGRIASLLEVGTGFHPDLSGRDNIFLNGAILGMSKQEIKSKFDEIVDFSGVEKYIDTPVKRYSSGMYVRLAFAVAAHLEPEILIVDEVLAVGDAEFQKKCIGKMKDVSVSQGRTVLFVSHSMASIRVLCSRALLLNQGSINFDGDVSTALDYYLEQNTLSDSGEISLNDRNLEANVLKVQLLDKLGFVVSSFTNDEDVSIYVDIQVDRKVNEVEFSICIKNSNHVNVIFSSLSDNNNKVPVSFSPGTYRLRAQIDANFLVPDRYSISLYTHFRNIKSIKAHENILKFRIEDIGSLLAPYGKESTNIACVLGGANWTYKKV